MRSTHLPALATARFLVGALGERLGWWPSRFTDPASKRSLELLFPRTFLRAALESVSEVAQLAHDADLSPRSFHLFRLPVHLEDRLAGWLARPEATLAWPPADREALLVEIARHGDGGLRPSPGPLCLGRPGRLNQATAIREIVALYLTAARAGIRVVPYFEE